MSPPAAKRHLHAKNHGLDVGSPIRGLSGPHLYIGTNTHKLSISCHGDDSERFATQSWDSAGLGVDASRENTTKIDPASRDLDPSAWTHQQASGDGAGLLVGRSSGQAKIGTEICKKTDPEPFSRPLKLPGPRILFLGCLRAIPRKSRPPHDMYVSML